MKPSFWKNALEESLNLCFLNRVLKIVWRILQSHNCLWFVLENITRPFQSDGVL